MKKVHSMAIRKQIHDGGKMSTNTHMREPK